MSKRTITTNTNAAIAYYRVSTKRQGESGLGLEAQKESVTAYARSNGMQIEAEYVEVETGTSKRARTEIYRAIEHAKRIGAVLVIAKIDRLSRNVHFISGLHDSKVRFVTVDMPSATELTVNIYASMAQEEAKMISARTKAALAAAKARGVKLGTPSNLTSEAQQKGAAANRAAAIEAMKPAACMAQNLHQQGMTLRAIAEVLNTNGFRTREGKTFQAMQIKRLLDRRFDC
jgi:DNA invertase Pin-like site-specific DNA recombinase